MNDVGSRLLCQLQKLPHISFTVRGRLDEDRYLPRYFPQEYPFILQLHQYPGYQNDVGETWLHWHDYYELVLMVSGSGTYHCGDRRFDFKAGDVIAVPPLKLHGVWRVKTPHTALCCFFHRSAIALHETSVDQAFVDCFHQSEKASAFHVNADEVSERLYRAFEEMCLSWFQSETDQRDWCEVKLQLLQILYRLRFHLLNSEPHKRNGNTVLGHPVEPLIRQILEYIAKHATEKISQADVARVAGMSVSRFRSFFKETTGWRYCQYLLNVRLELAAQMLRETKDSIAAIAHTSGFADQSHLQRAFKAHYHLSPLAYRKEYEDKAKNTKK